MGYHDVGRDATAQPKALAEVANFASTSKVLLRLHGAFMIAAWVGTASLGILIARYYKQTWVGKSLWGKDIWFTVSISTSSHTPTDSYLPYSVINHLWCSLCC